MALSDPNAIYSLANLNLYTSLSNDESSPLSMEKEKYELLLQSSILNSLRLHFIHQLGKITNDDIPNDNIISQERHLLMIDATHRLYQYFSNTIKPKVLDDFFSFANDVESRTTFDATYTTKFVHATIFKPLHSCMLKVLTQSPFNQYQPIRKAVFRWVQDLLYGQIEQISQVLPDGKFTYEHFQDFKFLVRRATLLNSNILLNEKLFTVLNGLYSSYGINSLYIQVKNRLARLKRDAINPKLKPAELEIINVDTLQEEDRFRNIQGFEVFFAAQVKELLLRNESRAARIELLVQGKNESLYTGYKKLLDILRLENSVALHQFYNFLVPLPEWQVLFNKNESKQYKILSLGAIKNLLVQPRIQNHQQFKILISYLKASGQDTPVDTENPQTDNGQLISYLWLRLFCSKEHELEITLKDRTEFLFTELSSICLVKNDSYEFRGAFLVIKDSLGVTYSVYDNNKENNHELFWDKWKNSNDIVISAILDNQQNSQNYRDTILEFKRDKVTGKWIEMHPSETVERPSEISEHFLSTESNRVILLKLNKHDKGKDISLGLAGFYFKSPSEEPSDVRRLQYILLLQQSLNDFVGRNHQNTLFREWLIAEYKKRYVLLTGHGKEMMINIISNIPKLKTVALHYEHIQAAILLNDNIMFAGGNPDLKLKLESYYNSTPFYIDVPDYLYERLHEMAKEIFESAFIENKVDIDIDLVQSRKFSFRASKAVLDLIFFELFLNAKKSGGIFLKMKLLMI